MTKKQQPGSRSDPQPLASRELDLIDARDNAARRIRFAAKVLRIEDKADEELNSSDLDSLSE